MSATAKKFTPKHSVAGSLGRALIRQRFGSQLRRSDGSVSQTNRHTTELADGNAWTLRSVTQENDLDEFLRNASLAGAEFTAERVNARLVVDLGPGESVSNQSHAKGSWYSAQETEAAKHAQLSHLLAIPRRPAWTPTTSASQLEDLENDVFLDWRRSLAALDEFNDVVVTPYERNINVWRQLWRVVERSHLVVCIVDARSPLFFRSLDLETYVKDFARPPDPTVPQNARIPANKSFLLLMNKSDLLTPSQRRAWKHYFTAEGVNCVFWSAFAAAKMNAASGDDDDDTMPVDCSPEDNAPLAEDLAQDSAQTPTPVDDSMLPLEEQSSDGESAGSAGSAQEILAASDRPTGGANPKATSKDDDDDVHLLSTTELLDLFYNMCPASSKQEPNSKPVIGLVGYPNVGKSSTLNAIFEKHLVSVSSTPGKTKHFQTHHLDKLILCDCPGLVFPSFAVTKADMYTLGVLPIDSMKDWRGPLDVVCSQIPKRVFEMVYGIIVKTKDAEGIDEIRDCYPEELAGAFAIGRGYRRGTQGQPDEHRAARLMLKDYVNGKLLYCHPPPGMDARKFNRDTFKALIWRFAKKRAASLLSTLPGEEPIPLARTFPKLLISKNLLAVERENIQAVATKISPFARIGTMGPTETAKKHKKGRRVKTRDQWVTE